MSILLMKLKFKLLHLSLYSVDLIVWTAEKNYYMVADFQDVREGGLLRWHQEAGGPMYRQSLFDVVPNSIVLC